MSTINEVKPHRHGITHQDSFFPNINNSNSLNRDKKSSSLKLSGSLAFCLIEGINQFINSRD